MYDIRYMTGDMLFFRGTVGGRAMAGNARQGRRRGKRGGSQPGAGNSARARPVGCGLFFSLMSRGVFWDGRPVCAQDPLTRRTRVGFRLQYCSIFNAQKTQGTAKAHKGRHGSFTLAVVHTLRRKNTQKRTKEHTACRVTYKSTGRKVGKHNSKVNM